MNKKIFLILSISVIILSFVLFGFKKDDLKKGEACFEENCFYIELAISSKEKAMGLMFRKELKTDQGMLFIFEKEDNHSFWMKNMEFPLDIIWINKNKEVVFIRENVQPCLKDKCEKIEPDEKASYVLELTAGKVGKIGIKKEDKVIFDLGSIRNPGIF